MESDPYPEKCGCGWAMPLEVWNYSLMQGAIFFRCKYCQTLWKVEEGKRDQYVDCKKYELK